MPSLTAPREGLGLAVAQDPASPAQWHIYATLGRSSGAAVLASYEFLSVTINPNGSQTVGASWTSGGANMVPIPRWQARGLHGGSTHDHSLCQPDRQLDLRGGRRQLGRHRDVRRRGLRTGAGGRPPHGVDVGQQDDHARGHRAGISLTTPRYLMGSTVESGRIFFLGGDTGGGVVTNSIENTVW